MPEQTELLRGKSLDVRTRVNAQAGPAPCAGATFGQDATAAPLCGVLDQSARELRIKSEDSSGGFCEDSCSEAVALNMRVNTTHRVLHKPLYDCSKSPTGSESDAYEININVSGNPNKHTQCECATYNIRKTQAPVLTYTDKNPCKFKYRQYSSCQLGTSKLQPHTRMGDKSYKCEHCEYNSVTICDMKRHTRTHSGEKLYKCEQCEYSASQLSNLKTHMRTHTCEKPYKCEQCEYSASQSRTLKLHMRIHTGEKPYKCEQCEYSASQLSNLKHMTHMQEKTI
ncbi:Zinc finger protein 513 [Eumeta japonica]|uniref:Zinc finger protein 513 n=1 Tax=Eumeta variegata TaxID=151549 RepID=A0A4C1ZJQ1_EUMVA|nr:Zinc finger protein 513 [Eumeta japonica]